MKQSTERKYEGVFNRLHAKHRFLISALIAGGAYITIVNSKLNTLTQIVIALDVFALVNVAMSWINFFTTPQHELRSQAKEQDSSRVIVFVIILACAAASLLGVTLLLLDDDKEQVTRNIRLIAGVSGMVFSWLLVHTFFTYRYAHLFYANHHTKAGEDWEGLEFPSDTKPDFLDFAYFSFVLGMTFQVSDVQITEKKLRRLALLHGLISFLYNTAIIALTINIIAGWRSGR